MFHRTYLKQTQHNASLINVNSSLLKKKAMCVAKDR